MVPRIFVFDCCDGGNDVGKGPEYDLDEDYMKLSKEEDMEQKHNAEDDDFKQKTMGTAFDDVNIKMENGQKIWVGIKIQIYW